MFAWPSNSWITRKSAPCSSRCVAKLCRSMCGVMLRATPARRTRFLMRSHKRHRRERRAALRQKNIRRRFRRDEFGPPGFEVTIQRFHRFSPDRHDALLVALADDVDEPGVEMKLFQPQIFQFGQPQAGGVGQFQNRLVAQAFRRFRRFRREQFCDFVVRQRLGQTFPAARQRQIFRDVDRQQSFRSRRSCKTPATRRFPDKRSRCSGAWWTPSARRPADARVRAAETP